MYPAVQIGQREIGCVERAERLIARGGRFAERPYAMAIVARDRIAEQARQCGEVEAAAAFAHELGVASVRDWHASFAQAGPLRLQLPSGRGAQVVKPKPQVVALAMRIRRRIFAAFVQYCSAHLSLRPTVLGYA